MPTVSALDERRVYRKVIWRLMPFLFICYIFAYVDRVNVGYANLGGMGRDLAISDAVFLAGSGFFFVGYLLFQVPCNLALQKIGAKRWLGPIMIVWGVVSAVTMFVKGTRDFYIFRFVLGVVESGFFPGVILYLTYWFTNKYRAQMVAVFMTAIPLAPFIFSPISGAIIKLMNGFGGLRGWQWLFVIEAAPSVLAGLAAMVFLEDNPQKAKWLSESERELLLDRLAEDEAKKKRSVGAEASFLAAIRKPAVWLFCLIYFGPVCGNYLLQFWMPRILNATLSHDAVKIGFLSMMPWGVAAITMVLVGRHSDKTGERCYHVALCAIAGGLGLVLSAIPGAPSWVIILGLSMAAAGAVSSSSSFWSLPAMYLSGPAASAGIALINSLGNLGGYFGPKLYGIVDERFHSSFISMATLTCLAWGSALINIAFFRGRRID